MKPLQATCKATRCKWLKCTSQYALARQTRTPIFVLRNLLMNPDLPIAYRRARIGLTPLYRIGPRSVCRLEGGRTAKGGVGWRTDGSFYFFLEPPYFNLKKNLRKNNPKSYHFSANLANYWGSELLLTQFFKFHFKTIIIEKISTHFFGCAFVHSWKCFFRSLHCSISLSFVPFRTMEYARTYSSFLLVTS